MNDLSIVINVVTLNCWGIPYVSKNREQRMNAIAKYLSKGLYDIVSLQEVWDENDFFRIRDAIKEQLPYSHYFYSGVFGSGLCLFSRWPILEVFFHAWPLNGYMHMVHHGDWFGGKGVGFCKIKYGDLNLHVYSAHLHAEYNTEDIYLAHRVLQAFDTAQFIKMTSSNADAVILAGDLNIQPSDLAFRFLCQIGNLKDTYADYISSSGEDVDLKNIIHMGTNERACNSYTDPVSGKLHPEGKRIDYILYNTGKSYIGQLEKYDLPIVGNIPDLPFSYSDHEAVYAKLSIKPSPNSNSSDVLSGEFVNNLQEGITICDEAMDTLRYSSRKYLIYALSLFLLLLSTVGMAERTYIDMPRLLLVVIMSYFLIMGTVWNRIERNGVLSGQIAMRIMSFNDKYENT